ncbi:MAG: hypothetical protein QOG89_1942, partial [Thermomicrobiales bacterium]|nr:hypothetical protein [Thermomicrobiales bacterium]
RIVLMSHRPSTIVSTITLDQPRPRQRGDASLAPLRAQILTHFGFGAPHAPTHAGAQAGLNQPLAASR